MSDWDGKERRTDAVMIAEMMKDIKTLLTNQSEIKEQVKKTNGRVTFLEKMIWMFAGGGALFLIIFQDRVVEVLIGI